MATIAQTLANRENASHSTGPVTDAGKSAASRNSLKHGLSSSKLMVEGENFEAFTAMENALIDEHLPETPTEMLLVRDMAKFHWLMDRAIYLQGQALERISIYNMESPIALSLLIRYQTTNDRAFHKALSALAKLRKENANSKIGSVPQEAAEPAAPTADQAAFAGFDDFLKEITRPRTPQEAREEAEMDAFDSDAPLYPAA